jgi:hypothetical protein
VGADTRNGDAADFKSGASYEMKLRAVCDETIGLLVRNAALVANRCEKGGPTQV